MVKEIPKWGKTWSISIDVKFTKDAPWPGNIFMFTTRAEWDKMKNRYSEIKNNPSAGLKPHLPASWPAFGVDHQNFHFDYAPPAGWESGEKGQLPGVYDDNIMEWELINDKPKINTTATSPNYAGTANEKWRCSGKHPFHCIEDPNRTISGTGQRRYNYMWTESIGKRPHYRKTWDQTNAQQEIFRLGFLRHEIQYWNLG